MARKKVHVEPSFCSDKNIVRLTLYNCAKIKLLCQIYAIA